MGYATEAAIASLNYAFTDMQLKEVFADADSANKASRRVLEKSGLKFIETFDDDGARKGYCLYKMGCRGPVTYNACSVTKWNEGTSYPIQSGHGCIGCSENGFWDNGPFYKHLPSFPGFGIESTADTIGLAAAAATAAGIGVHAVSTNIRKRKLIKENMILSYQVRMMLTEAIYFIGG